MFLRKFSITSPLMAHASGTGCGSSDPSEAVLIHRGCAVSKRRLTITMETE